MRCDARQQTQSCFNSVRNLYKLIWVLATVVGVLAPVLAQPIDSVRAVIAPKMVHKPPLTFPEEAQEASLTGKLWLKVMVTRDGTPAKTEILKRDPEMAFMFDDAARRWAMQCRFSPAKDSVGNPVAVWVTIPINFKMQDFEPPRVVRQTAPEYPEEARSMGLEGWVGVAVFVSDMGNALNAKSVIVARDPPYYRLFDDAAKAAAKASEYSAATYNGRPTNGWCFVKIVFALRSNDR